MSDKKSSRDKPDVLDRRFVHEGDIIIHEGEIGTNAFLIQSGSVRVFSRHGGKKVTLAHLEMGDIFGEMAVIGDDEVRTASVEAAEESTLIVINQQLFEEKLERSDPTIRAVVRMLRKRIVSSNIEVSNKKTNMNDLVETTNTIYQNILGSLDKNEIEGFHEAILPKMDAFLDAVKKIST